MVRGSHAWGWHGWGAALCALLFTWSLVVQAQPEEGRVRVEGPLNGDALVEESVTRTVGELSALGLEVEVLHRSLAALVQRQMPALESGLHGLIAVYRLDGRVHVDTWAPNGGRALQLDFDPMERGMNAEVIAIRAVESLRTRWLEYEQQNATGLPERVASIAHSAPSSTVDNPAPSQPEPSVDSLTPPTGDVAPPLLIPEPERAPRPLSWLTFTLGAGVAVESAGTSHATANVGAGVRLGPVTLGLAFDTSLSAFEFADAVGSLEGSRTRLLLDLSAQFAITRALETILAAKAGVARYWLDASVTAPGYIEHDRASLDATAAAVLGLRYWFEDHVALHLASEVNALRKGLAIDVAGQELGRIGLPGVGLQAGLTIGFP